MLKFVILDAGFPIAVVLADEKSIAAYTPGMLIDELRQRAVGERNKDNDGVAIMLDASAAMLEAVIHKHYGTSIDTVKRVGDG